MQNPDTIQRLDRTDDESEAETPPPEAPFAPDEAWINAFDAQCTEDLYARLRASARRHAFGVQCAGRKVDDYYERELVQDAITDTLTGTLRWDPARATLRAHLESVLQWRARDHRVHAKNHPHDALGENSDASRAAEIEASSIRHTDVDRAEAHAYAEEVLALIRERAHGDKPVLRILDAYVAGAETKADVLALTHMRERTYHNARVRLGRILDDLFHPAFASCNAAA
jgi:hypothetical protein